MTLPSGLHFSIFARVNLCMPLNPLGEELFNGSCPCRLRVMQMDRSGAGHIM
jgi:hypothetical protein